MIPSHGNTDRNIMGELARYQHETYASNQNYHSAERGLAMIRGWPRRGRMHSGRTARSNQRRQYCSMRSRSIPRPCACIMGSPAVNVCWGTSKLPRRGWSLREARCFTHRRFRQTEHTYRACGKVMRRSHGIAALCQAPPVRGCTLCRRCRFHCQELPVPAFGLNQGQAMSLRSIPFCGLLFGSLPPLDCCLDLRGDLRLFRSATLGTSALRGLPLRGSVVVD